MITLEQQIAEVERELSLRQRVYAAQVAAGRLKQADTTHQRHAMLAVLATLKDLARTLDRCEHGLRRMECGACAVALESK